MKKKALTLLLFTILTINFIGATIECSTIADIRKQTSGTNVKYTGTATTTFYGLGGILIKDTTGCLYVKNALLSELGTSNIRINMQITNICGTFNSATDLEMSHIEVNNRTLESIDLVNENATFVIEDITLDELLTNPMNYECCPIRLTDIKVINNGYSYSIGNDNDTITLVAGWDVEIPTRGTFEGYYGNNGTQGFIIPSAKNVIATAYNTILDIKNTYETESPNSLGIEKGMIVNHIIEHTDGSADIYVQQTDIYQTNTGIVLHIENYNNNINIGDSINGVKGKFTSFIADDNNKVIGSKITISENEAKSINVINSGNTLNAALIDDIEYIIGWGAKNHEGVFIITPKGKILKKKINDTEKYTLDVEGKYIVIDGIDCSKFENENVAIIGTLDAGFINEGESSIILRSEKDILATTYTFNSLEEMKEAGQPLATGVTYTLNNNVLVTHVHSWILKDINLTVYGMFVQDATGGLFIQTQSKLDLVAGDSISGISGTFHAYEDIAPYLDLKSIEDINKISGNYLSSITYEEVTMKTLLENPEKYASSVVKLMEVGYGTRQVTNQGTTENQKFLYQNKDTMIYEIWDYALYETSNIIGVFDYGSYRKFSIIPLSQNHIENSAGTAIKDNYEDENVIIYRDNTILATSALNIKIFNIDGLLLKNSNNDNINISSLNTGVYIVVVTHKDNSTQTVKIVK